MGCDIHLCTEVKINGEWLTYGTPNVPRNYKLFGVLAGVRGAGPVFPAKGFPQDAGEVTRWRYYGPGHSDWHTPSYLTAEEIESLYDMDQEILGVNPLFLECGHGNRDWRSMEVGYLAGNTWRVLKYGLPEGIEDVRWIFWFDS